MAQFDPSEKGVDDVLKYLKTASKAERERVLAAEVSGKKRKTVLEPYGIDADARYDAEGRQLYPWEVDAKSAADAHKQPEETAEQRAAREAQNELDTTVASTPQLGSTPAESGTAPAAPTAPAAAPTGSGSFGTSSTRS